MQRAGQSQSPVGWEGGGEEHKYSAVMYETEDGKTTSKSSRLIKVTNLVMIIMSTRSMNATAQDGGESSSNENIRYQAMDMIKKDTRVHR